MDRREFLGSIGAATLTAVVPRLALAQEAYRNLLVLVELKGGNDGLNTIVPYADRDYYALRPRLAIPSDQVLRLDSMSGLHPALAPLMPLWQTRELAVVQGLGYPDGNLSHFRSIEIWDTASKSNEYLNEGWLARTFALAPAPRSFAADAVVVGGAELGPFAGGARTIALANPEQFLRQARLAAPAGQGGNPALAHVLKVERDIALAASRLDAGHAFRTDFPHSRFGNAVRTAAQVIASPAGVAAVRLSLDGFDTHGNQQGVHERLLGELAEGLVALRSALVEINRWASALVMTYAEFGRRPRENQSGGTDHGTANAHLVLGGRVKGGLYGAPPALGRLDGNGNPPFAVDFRELYATVLDQWWNIDSAAALRARFRPVDLLKA